MQTYAQSAHAAYQSGEITSADPVRIIVLLYEGALCFSRVALQGFDDPATRGQALGRAHRILSELLAALDHEKGGEIADNLDGMYRYMMDCLTNSNVNNDKKALQSVIDVLNTMLPAWRQIEKKGEQESESQAP